MRQFAKVTVAPALMLLASLGAAGAQEACKSYRATVGDTLLTIAAKAYGNRDYMRIYKANQAAIGKNPDLLKVGTLLTLPCADGSLPEAATKTAAERAPAPEIIAAQAAKVVESVAPVVLITGNDFLPFTDESLPGRGMFTELVETAALRSDPDREFEVKFVNDWAAHLDTLLPIMAFDGSFPWAKPDCSQFDTLSPDDKYRCENYEFSAPFYEVVDGIFSRKNSGFAEMISYDQLVGTRICRPDGLSTARLDSVGLSAPKVKLYRPGRVAACFEALMAGSVDIVALNSQVASDMIAEMGLSGEVVENPNLGEVNALYVVVHKQNPRGREVLDFLNAGLADMMKTGEWYDIVSKALNRQLQLQVN